MRQESSGPRADERLARGEDWLYVQCMNRTISPIQPLLDLFETSLAEVRFADVDTKTLLRAAGDVESAENEVDAAQAVLDGARAKLQERQEALLQQAHRALAYARVYAE